MGLPQVEYKLNIVSLANLGALVGLLLTLLSLYSGVVESRVSMEKDRDIFKIQIMELQKQNKSVLDQIQNLIGQDSDLRLTLANLQAQLSGRLAVLEVELRQLNTTVSKIEGAVQGSNLPRRR